MAVSQPFFDLSPSLWDRLPTPISFDDSSTISLLSPPLSRASSPPPLPSPPPDSIPPPAVRQVGKKTSAFFAPPFQRAPSPPPPRSTTPDPSAHKSKVFEPEYPQSANSFFAKTFATPTPPPSIHSPSAEHPIPRLPPIARFFPSRAPVSRDPDLFDPSDNNSPPKFLILEESTLDDSQQTVFVTTSKRPTPTRNSFAKTVSTVPPIFKTEPQSPIQSDPQLASTATDLIQPTEGLILGTDVPLKLIRELGHGSFSCVWLARDMDHQLEQRPGTTRRRSESFARRKEDRVMQGLKPQISLMPRARSESFYLAQRDGEGATAACDENGGSRGQLVAIKMIDRARCDVDDRTRISFVREVEVLRHISHPSIVSYLHSFTTATHHCLVLEALLGGELFELLDHGDNHSRMTEPLLRRMFGELCQAVGWMHGVGLIHRDLKLENILLTTNPFLNSPITLASLPSPLVKLTDFGLARFIDPASPMLATRCGSESYAAPEIVTGKSYDGRQTDAWACGVVLYALTTRALPFDRASGERDTRRAHLMRIAQGEYAWPAPAPRLATEGVKSVVARLLVRDPARRARVVEVWDEEWMRAEGAPMPPLAWAGSGSASESESGSGSAIHAMGQQPAGRLVGNDIPSVAKQEL